MTVTAVERRRGSLYQVTLDGETAYMIDKNTWDESALDVGSSLDAEKWDALVRASSRRRAHSRALYLLSLRDYPAKTLRQKVMEGGADAADANAAVDRMIELGLVDDERYARRLARDLFAFKHFSARRVAQELQKKGIDRETAMDAAEEIGAEQDDLQQAIDFLRKKYYNKLGSEDQRRKTAQAMLRAGFDYDTVRRAMAATIDEDEEL